MTCLIGCINNYKVGQLKTLVEGDSVSPWVWLYFKGTDTLIDPYSLSVGNESSPYQSNNNAAIVSFKFGNSTKGGCGCDVEIVDQEGTAFQVWMERLNRNLVTINDDYQMNVRFGWTASNCGGNPSYLTRSPLLTFLPLNIESAYEQGYIKYKIQGVDLMQTVFQTRTEKIYPQMKLKPALRALFRDNVPSVTSVDFWKASNTRHVNGGDGEWEFKPDNKQDWPSNQQNALATARSWISRCTTNSGKGIFANWNPVAQIVPVQGAANNNVQYGWGPPASGTTQSNQSGGVIFWEDTEPGCNENINAQNRSLGTYIVNGGSCSPVISFNPKVQWNFQYGAAAGGRTAGTVASGGYKMPGQCGDTPTGTGLQTATVARNSTLYPWGVTHNDQVLELRAEAAHQKANMTFQSIMAEMVVQGDPTLADPVLLVGGMFSVVVINPFHLAGDAANPNWLATSTCNQVFSNKNWLVLGVDHDITQGSYHTTLKLMLAAPGTDINVNQPVGGAGSNGETLPRQ